MKSKPPRRVIVEATRSRSSETSAATATFSHQLLLHPNAREAMQLVAQQARLAFDRDTGGFADQVRIEEEHLKADLQRSEERLAHLRDRLRETKEFESVAPDATSMPFRQWPLKDRVLFVVAILLSVTVVCMGSANVYTNLVSSGIPVFLEQPWCAWLLSAVPPCASYALHLTYQFLQSERSRAKYMRALFGATAVLVLAWSLSFAQQFAGVTSSIVLDLNSNDHGGSLFVWLQLSSEIALGTTLGWLADEIASKHTPGRYQRTAEYQEVESTLKTQESVHNRLRSQYIAAARKIRETDAAREVVANAAAAEFLARKARFSAYQSDSQ